jgi:hypothetical protein
MPGSFDGFLDNLRGFESGIDPAKAAWYAANYNNPTAISYPDVTTPGHAVRDANGNFINQTMSVKEYFQTLGVDQYYNPATPNDPAMLETMQYHSTNFIGFLGYQVGEAVLISAGYYAPTIDAATGYDKYYVWVGNNSIFANGVTEAQYLQDGATTPLIATSINRWEGTFTGKNGVNSLDDLKNPALQEVVIRDVMAFNVGVISELLKAANMTWTQALAKTWTMPDGTVVQSTMSGILASAHLRGAWGTADLLIHNTDSTDENGTSIKTYMKLFGGFDTIYDTPGNDHISGSQYNENLFAGQGNDLVDTGGGHDKIYLSEYAGATTTINNFTIHDDVVVLRGFTAANPLSNVSVTSNAQGNAVIHFASEQVVLTGVTAASVQANLADVIKVSDLYNLAWSGKVTVAGFDVATDVIHGTAGIGFKNLQLSEDANGNAVVGVVAADGGIYAGITLTGVSMAQVTPNMFENVTGAYTQMVQAYNFDWSSWGWAVSRTVEHFDAAHQVLNIGAFQYNFSALELVQVGNDTKVQIFGGGEGGKSILLKGVDVDDLSAKNFYGVSGTYSSVHITHSLAAEEHADDSAASMYSLALAVFGLHDDNHRGSDNSHAGQDGGGHHQDGGQDLQSSGSDIRAAFHFDALL